MTTRIHRGRAGRPNRRAFLRGVGGAALALPFLESVPERSPWAATDPKPVFGFFICGVEGVVRSSFLPPAVGPLTQDGLAAAGKATSQLARHADNLLMVSGIDWPPGSTEYDPHADGLIMSLTAKAPLYGLMTGMWPPDGINDGTAAGPSAEFYIASKAKPAAAPIVLYAGNPRSFDGPRLSFSDAAKQAPVTANPYDLYLKLSGLATPDGGMTPGTRTTAQLLLDSRKSIHDLVQGELTTLMQDPRLSAADRQRLQLHLDSVRDAEKMMTGMAGDAVDRCSAAGLDVTSLEALQGYVPDPHRTDEMVGLHMSLVAMAFACNYSRAASLQWGDPYDSTLYDVPSNGRNWKFSFISHRLQSDSAIGSDSGDPLAAAAHAEIDVVRMKTLAGGLDHFKARGLADQCFVLWTINYAEGPSHAFVDIPHIIWGNGGGFLKQASYVDANHSTNNRLLNTLISAALQDSNTVVDNFGDGTPGLLDVIRAG